MCHKQLRLLQSRKLTGFECELQTKSQGQRLHNAEDDLPWSCFLHETLCSVPEETADLMMVCESPKHPKEPSVSEIN